MVTSLASTMAALTEDTQERTSRADAIALAKSGQILFGRMVSQLSFWTIEVVVPRDEGCKKLCRRGVEAPFFVEGALHVF